MIHHPAVESLSSCQAIQSEVSSSRVEGLISYEKMHFEVSSPSSTNTSPLVYLFDTQLIQLTYHQIELLDTHPIQVDLPQIKLPNT